MSEFNHLMPIRSKGSKPPLFCIHGEPLQIAFRIRKDRPVYGVSLLYHPRLGNLGSEMPVSIEEYAALYVADMRRVQPRGPYYICGFSAGGMIAFEMARQLLAAGEILGDLTLVEPTIVDFGPEVLPDVGTKLSSTWKTIMSSPDRMQAFIAGLKKLRWSMGRRMEKYIGIIGTEFFLRLKPQRTLPETLRWSMLIKFMEPVLFKYRYETLSCPATLVYCSMDETASRACNDYWQPKFANQARIVSIPGAVQHLDLMEDPSLGETIKLLDVSVN